jgi:hypothetical protein
MSRTGRWKAVQNELCLINANWILICNYMACETCKSSAQHLLSGVITTEAEETMCYYVHR